MSIFKKVAFILNGNDYEIEPNMKMIKEIWNLADLVELRKSMILGTPHVPDLSLVLSKAIGLNGGDLSADEIFVYFNSGGTTAQVEVIKAIGLIYSSVFPPREAEESEEEKKSNSKT